MRTLAIRISVSKGARCVRVWDEGNTVLTATSIDGTRVRDVFRFSPERDEMLFRLMTGDASSPSFRMHHCVLPPDGSLDVVLATRAGTRTKLRVVAEINGLPEIVTPRDGPMPEGESDVTLVSRGFSL